MNKPMFIIPLTLHNILICHIPPVKWGPLILVNFAECNCLVLGDGVSRQMNYVIDEDKRLYETIFNENLFYAEMCQ